MEEALAAYQQEQEQNNQALRYDLMLAAQKRMEEVGGVGSTLTTKVHAELRDVVVATFSQKSNPVRL